MKLELNLLENSHDYINSSLELFMIADEHGMHDEQRSEFENKVKWKLAFVTMVQAVELLLKEYLFRINTNLIYENIDFDKPIEKKTVSFHRAINRINNLSNNAIAKEQKMFLANCSQTRNEYIHFKVSIQSEKIKSRYCTLYTIYKELHNKFFDEDVKLISKNKNSEIKILEYNQKWNIFRGREIKNEDLEEFKGDIEKNSKYICYITKNEKKVQRIKFGDESNHVKETYKLNNNQLIYSNFDICDDCFAKIGEFHLNNCDLEICPVCFEQIISCDCLKSDEDGKLTMTTDWV